MIDRGWVAALPTADERRPELPTPDARPRRMPTADDRYRSRHRPRTTADDRYRSRHRPRRCWSANAVTGSSPTGSAPGRRITQ
ncbi:hypothetical protein ACWEH3_09655 [Nocardia sp. NPDC004718]